MYFSLPFRILRFTSSFFFVQIFIALYCNFFVEQKFRRCNNKCNERRIKRRGRITKSEIFR